MATAENTAKFLLYLASQDKLVNDLSNLKLQKLLYYSQGSFIQNNNNKFLFDDTLEAWQYGPVVRSVYQEYSKSGRLPIDVDILSDPDLENLFDLEDKEIEAILIAWNNYSYYTASQLVEKTHSELPWYHAWNSRQRKIEKGDMIRTFGNQ